MFTTLCHPDVPPFLIINFVITNVLLTYSNYLCCEEKGQPLCLQIQYVVFYIFSCYHK